MTELTPLTDDQQYKINSVLKHFDFERVHSVMRFLEWSWQDGGVPTLEQVRGEALRLLEQVVREGMNSIRTGGFFVSHEDDELTLMFCLDHTISSDYV